MTTAQLNIIKGLLHKGRYLLPRMKHSGRQGYMLYEGNANPLYWYSCQTFNIIRDVIKKDKDGRITLNLNDVRQLHGKSTIKILYKKSRNGSN